ncbi:MAG: hypothetical protein K9N51_13950 [Candidatus Pacebacteria bacterium]|nr:hypothetical protein [Candidatus Paceibacterota bacterium]
MLKQARHQSTFRIYDWHRFLIFSGYMLRRFAQLKPLWVVALGILGYLYPPPLVWFKPYLEWMFFGTMVCHHRIVAGAVLG